MIYMTYTVGEKRFKLRSIFLDSIIYQIGTLVDFFEYHCVDLDINEETLNIGYEIANSNYYRHGLDAIDRIKNRIGSKTNDHVDEDLPDYSYSELSGTALTPYVEHKDVDEANKVSNETSQRSSARLNGSKSHDKQLTIKKEDVVEIDSGDDNIEMVIGSTKYIIPIRFEYYRYINEELNECLSGGIVVYPILEKYEAVLSYTLAFNDNNTIIVNNQENDPFLIDEHYKPLINIYVKNGWLEDKSIKSFVMGIAFSEFFNGIDWRFFSASSLITYQANKKKGVKYSKSADGDNVDVFFFVINTGIHWGLVVIFSKSSTMYYFDSSSGDSPSIENFHEETFKDCHSYLTTVGYRISDFSNFVFIYGTSNQQQNGSDCGVHVCMNVFQTLMQIKNRTIDYNHLDLTFEPNSTVDMRNFVALWALVPYRFRPRLG